MDRLLNTDQYKTRVSNTHVILFADLTDLLKMQVLVGIDKLKTQKKNYRYIKEAD